MDLSHKKQAGDYTGRSKSFAGADFKHKAKAWLTTAVSRTVSQKQNCRSLKARDTGALGLAQNYGLG